jgi:hypothetical protein
MFKLFSQDERYAFQKKVDDLERELYYQKEARRQDAETITLRADIDGQNKRLDLIEACLKAEARAEAAVVAEEYAKKAVEMSSKCAADFGSAVATLTEKVLDCLKEFKPVTPIVTVVPGTKEVHHGDGK